MQQQTVPTMTMLPLSLITIGNNPRKHFDQGEMDELVSSIRVNGILQPILVRSIEGGYAIVAGERRYRAASLLQLAEIPAVIKEMSEEEADAAALIENSIRADMSVTEEADAAGRIMARHDGNKEEAAATLGWPMSKLTRRLALLNLTEGAKTALNERRIMVGHAELLAALPMEKQDKALSNIIEHNFTVQQVRDLLFKLTSEFSRAIFDTAECNACHHNSSQQATLFSIAVEQGRCTHKDCFSRKTAEKIAAIKAEVEEEYPNVRLIEVGDPASYVVVTAGGDLGVGEEQIAACKGCGNYGATVSAIPGSEGKIERGICFDSVCHQKKVATRIKAEKAAQCPSTHSKTPAGSSAESTVKGKDTKKATASALSEKVKEYRRKQVWNVAAANELRNQTGKASSFLIDLLLTGQGSKVDSHRLKEVFKSLMGEDNAYPLTGGAQPETIHAMLAEHKRQLLTEAAASAVPAIEESGIKGLLSFLDTDLSAHWTLNADFLGLLTKSEIEAVCTDMGLAAEMADFKKVIGGKKDEAIKAIMASGFNFAGKVPSLLAYASEEQSNN